MTLRVILVTDDYSSAVVRKYNEYFVMSAFEGITKDAIPEHSVAAFTKHGFYACGAIFWEDEDARQFLAKQYVDTYKRSGNELPTHAELRELIKYIDAETAVSYLNRIENELIPSCRYEIAKEIAQDLKETDAVRTDPVILGRVNKILEICSNENI
jgi:hypothetical protein